MSDGKGLVTPATLAFAAMSKEMLDLEDLPTVFPAPAQRTIDLYARRNQLQAEFRAITEKGADHAQATSEDIHQQLRAATELQRMTKEANESLSRRIAEVARERNAFKRDLEKVERELHVTKVMRDHWKASANLYREAATVDDPRTAALEAVALAAMRYSKAQSARYQRELLGAIEELEKLPKEAT